MATIIEEIEIRLEMSDMLRRVPLARVASADGFVEQTPRESGVHMSGILRPLAIAAKQLKEGSQEWDEEAGEYPVLWALGVAWEEFVASLYPEMDYQPGSVEVDGIHMTCDGISVVDGVGTVEEMKYTHVSSAKPMLEQWMKLQQGKAYCKGYGVRRVRWHQLHVRGDYKSFGPVYRRSLVEFTEDEIRKCWSMFVNNKALAVPE